MRRYSWWIPLGLGVVLGGCGDDEPAPGQAPQQAAYQPPAMAPQPYAGQPPMQGQWGAPAPQSGYGQWGSQGQRPAPGQWSAPVQQPMTGQWGAQPPQQNYGQWGSQAQQQNYGQWGMQGQASVSGQTWPQTGAQQPQQAMPYTPPAENPWQRPPSGFGGGFAPSQQWQPAPSAGPQFRPLEQEQGKQPYRSGVPLVAPYDRPMGSSQDTPAAAWPGYYPGYPGAPNPWMVPGAAGPWPGW